MWSLGGKFGDRGGAVSACVLFAVSPLSVFYSTEGRMYSLLAFWSLGLIWTTMRLWERGPGVARFALWIALSAAGLFTHYFFAFVWLAALFWLLLFPGRFPRTFSAGAGLLTVLLILPWYIHIPHTMAQWRVPGNWQAVKPYEEFNRLTAALALPWSFLSIDGVWGEDQVRGWMNAGLFLILGLAVFWKAPGSIFSTPRNLLWFFVLSSGLGLLAFDAARGTYIVAYNRYALAGMPAALLLVGVGLECLGRRARAAFLGAIVLLSVVTLYHFFRGDARHDQNYPEVAKLLSRQAGKSDLILVHSIPSGVIGIARYLERNGGSKSGVGFGSWVGQLGKRVPEDLQALAAGRERIILVTTHDVRDAHPEQSWLEANAEPAGVKEIHGCTVRYFTPRGSALFLAPPGKSPPQG
jgi:hypothetical protein